MSSGISRIAVGLRLSEEVEYIMDKELANMRDALIDLITGHEARVKNAELQRDQSEWRTVPKRKAAAGTGSAQTRKTNS